MVSSYLSRSLEATLRLAVAQFPAVILTGPRQSGKTTLLQHSLAGSYEYVPLDAPDILAAALADPRAFLAKHPPPVVFDEIQHAAVLLPYIKEAIDRRRQDRGQYVLTGSQNLLMMQNVTESLAGRVAVLDLLPLSFREAQSTPDALLPWESPQVGRKALPIQELWLRILCGNYPELVAGPGSAPEVWHRSYIRTYLERDVRTLRQVGDLVEFQTFMRLLAARHGQVLNLSDVARELGIAVNTAKAWLSVLETGGQVFRLPPYFANLGKRVIKSPKLYFTDSGTVCHLVGLHDPDHAAHGPMAGPLFEGTVVMEVVKALLHRGRRPLVYFWRTSAGDEVDLLVEDNGSVIPMEVKLSATPRPQMGDSIRKFAAALGVAAAPGYVVHPGDVRLPLGQGVTALPFAEL